MIQLKFGQRTALQVVPHPDGDLLAVRLSSGRNAVALHLETSVAAAMRDLLAQYVKVATAARRQPPLRTAEGRPVKLGELLRRVHAGTSTEADMQLLFDAIDRLGIL